MKHNIVLEGFAFRIRPVTLDDSIFIANLRSGDDERLRYINRTSDDPLAQECWIREYFERPGDYYWVVERKNGCIPEGTISLYNQDPDRNEIEWGRWVLTSNSMASVESAMLIYQVAFDVINVTKVYCRTILSNSKVVSFHDSCGLQRESILQDFFTLGPEKLDAVQHGLTRERYPLVRERLHKLAELFSRRIV
jgi:RimJ/RimL family protein N-acetyltransferase